MYAKRLWVGLRLLPAQYTKIMKEYPNLNSIVHSVASSVITYYLTIAIVDSDTDKLIKQLNTEIEDLKVQRNEDLERLKELKDDNARVLSENQGMRNKYFRCYMDLVICGMELKVAKADFKNSFCLYRCKTFDDSLNNKSENNLK